MQFINNKRSIVFLLLLCAFTFSVIIFVYIERSSSNENNHGNSELIAANLVNLLRKIRQKASSEDYGTKKIMDSSHDTATTTIGDVIYEDDKYGTKKMENIYCSRYGILNCLIIMFCLIIARI